MNDFTEKLEYSLGEAQKFDASLLMKHIPRCVSVEKTNIEMDKKGVDYIARLAGGAEIYIDAKTRTKGQSKYWKSGKDGMKIPELALEVWSVVGKKAGWTINEDSPVDYILYTFHESDCRSYYFLPFQLLRQSFRKNFQDWKKKYGVKVQINNGWKSTAIFVPAPVVVNAITAEMHGII